MLLYNTMRGNFYYRRLGNRISGERKCRDLTQEKLALLAEVDRTYLARIEEGKANPSIKVLYKIARRLRIRLCDLLKGV